MKTMKNKTPFIVGGILLLLAVPAVIFAATRRKPKRRGTTVTAEDPIKQTREEFERDRENAPVPVKPPIYPINISLPGLGTLGIPDFTFLTRWNDYTVNTASTSLNVRERPDSASKIVGKLAKGSTIKAKASGTKGWMAVSKDGVNTLGYSSLDYLKIKTTK